MNKNQSVMHIGNKSFKGVKVKNQSFKRKKNTWKLSNIMRYKTGKQFTYTGYCKTTKGTKKIYFNQDAKNLQDLKKKFHG